MRILGLTDLASLQFRFDKIMWDWKMGEVAYVLRCLEACRVGRWRCYSCLTKKNVNWCFGMFDYGPVKSSRDKVRAP